MKADVKIEVFGSGCPSCKRLFERTQTAVAELKLATEVEYVTDLQRIVEMGVMSSPVLAIDGEPVWAGSVPETEEIVELIGRRIVG